MWIIGLTLSRIEHEKLISKKGSQIINFADVWVLRIDYCAWNSVIALSEPNDKIWRWSCDAISSINFLCNFSISPIVSDPLLEIRVITTGENLDKGIF